MRIWDIPPKRLCRSHLLGEHRELHAIWSRARERQEGLCAASGDTQLEGKAAGVVLET